MFENRDIIYSYSREQALADGVLVDASETSHGAGFRYPVALTRAAFERCVAGPGGSGGPDEEGRLLGVVHMLYAAIRRGQEGSEVAFQVHVRNTNRGGAAPAVRLRAVCGPGDDGEPVITIMLPDED